MPSIFLVGRFLVSVSEQLLDRLERRATKRSPARLAAPHDGRARGYDARMGLMGDGYRGTYQGHTIELIRDNLAKKLKLVIDGVEVASEPRAMQHDITLTATLVHEGVSHRVVARSIVGRTTSGTVMIDGAPLTIART
jgi:hypothetical protein